MSTFNQKPHMKKWFGQCKDCPKRYPGCHAECEPYKQELAIYREHKHEEKQGRKRYLDAVYATEDGREEMGCRR